MPGYKANAKNTNGASFIPDKCFNFGSGRPTKAKTIMKKIILFFFAVIILANTYGQKTDVTINVHPGIELLTVIQKLADQFPNSTPSTYEKEVNDYFGNFKNLKAVNDIKNFKGNAYPDLTELGFCFSDFPNFKLHIPDSLDWYKYYGKDTVIKYLQDCICPRLTHLP